MKSKSDRKTPAKTASNYEKRHTDDTQQQTMTPEDTPKHTGSDPNEINTQSFNQSLKEYAKYFLWPAEERIVHQYFRGKVLDLGTGCGRTTVKLHELGFEVIGTDIANDMINYARKTFPHLKWQVVDAAKIPFPNESFDTVFFSYCGIDYLHPLSKRMECLREVFRVLKPEGRLIFSSHNASSPLTHFGSIRRIKATLHNKKLHGYRLEKTSGHPVITYFSTPGENLKHLKETGFIHCKIIDWLKGKLFNTKPYYVAEKH